MATRSQEVKQLSSTTGGFASFTRIQSTTPFSGTFMPFVDKNPFEDTFNHTTPGQRLLRSKDPARFKPPEATGLVQPEVRLGPSLPGIIHHHTRKLPSHGRALLTDPSVYLHNSLDDTKILSESLDQRNADLQLCQTDMCSGEGKTSNYLRMRAKRAASIKDDRRANAKIFWHQDATYTTNIPSSVLGKQDTCRHTFWSKSVRLGKPQGFSSPN